MPLYNVVYKSIYDFIIHVAALIRALTICKKCIVRACCTLECEEKILLYNFVFPYNVLHKNKILIFILSVLKLMVHYNIHLIGTVILEIIVLSAVVGTLIFT